MGKTIAEVFLDREGLEQFNDAVLAAVYDESAGARSTVRLWPGDDAERSVAVTTSYLVDRTDGQSLRVGIVAVLDDVTEVEALRKAEQALAESIRAQNVELRDAYRETAAKNKALDTALKIMTVVRVASRSARNVAQVLFEYGARVTADQALVVLDTFETHRRYRDARAGVPWRWPRWSSRRARASSAKPSCYWSRG